MFDQVGALAVHPGWVQTDMGGKQAPLTAQVLIFLHGVRYISFDLETGAYFLTWSSRFRLHMSCTAVGCYLPLILLFDPLF